MDKSRRGFFGRMIAGAAAAAVVKKFPAAPVLPAPAVLDSADVRVSNYVVGEQFDEETYCGDGSWANINIEDFK